MRNLMIILALLTSSTAIAAEHQHMNHNEMPQLNTAKPAAGESLHWNDGVIKKINPKKQKVTLKHGDIPGVMPAMTMSYRVTPWIDSLKPGDKVRFVLEKQNDDYVLTHIEAVK